jgi:hypothetical protein
VGESWLPESKRRKTPEVWVKVGYMNLCVDRDMNCG